MENTVDYNIEYSHLYYKYEDNLITEEHRKSIELTKQLILSLESQKKSYCLSVLVDTHEREHCDLDDIFKLLEKEGLTPDFIVNESALCEISRKVVKKIPLINRKTTKKGDVHFVLKLPDEEKRVSLIESEKDVDFMTCPLVATTWQLFRFGKIEHLKLTEENFKSYTNKPFIGNKTFTIIPKKFMRVESDVYDIISSIKSFRKIKRRILYIFY